MRAAVSSNRKYELLGETLALLTGIPYIFPRKSHDLTHNELKQWYRDRENESLNGMEKFFIDKGLVSHSDRLSKSAILGMVIEYLKRRQHVAPTTPAFNSPFLIDNLLKNDN